MIDELWSQLPADIPEPVQFKSDFQEHEDLWGELPPTGFDDYTPFVPAPWVPRYEGSEEQKQREA
jgi:hypothetical protein